MLGIGVMLLTLKMKKEKKAEDIPAVCEFRDVFPKELPGLPPQRGIDFEINFIPDAQSMSKASYRMAPIEFRELNIQLDELL